MRIGVYPGTFDPMTLGHLDVIARAARLVDTLVVGVTTNPSKSPLFSLEERIALVRAETDGLPDSVSVVPFDAALLVDFARSHGATTVVRGLRSAADFDYEYQMTGLNRRLAPDVEGVFLMSDPALQPISSTLVKEIARLGGDIAPFVTSGVRDAVLDKLGRRAPPQA